jgi:aspartate kinase
MSEVIVAKAGGTSNKDADAVMQSLEWSETSNIFVVSAPGRIDGVPEGDKVTNMLLQARADYISIGEVSRDMSSYITDRYLSISAGLGRLSLPKKWVDKIPLRIEEAVRQSTDAASMLGERLQAEVYESMGYTLLDPARAPHDLGSHPEKWKGWLSHIVEKGERYVLPGNITLVNGQLRTFSRGGSDTSGGLAAYAIEADLNLNLTDDSALSADPRIVNPCSRLSRIEHLLYEEGRELGRNGTGLVHPAAMIPLMIGNIPTDIRNTFDRQATPTRLDNDKQRAAGRVGEVVALSLMEDVTILRIHEPGMAEPYGRLAAFETALAENKVPLIDSKGDGVDGQKYLVDTNRAEIAAAALKKVLGPAAEIESSDNLSFITLVGYKLEQKLHSHILGLMQDSGINTSAWHEDGNDFSNGRHSIRISVSPDEARQILDNIHQTFIE